MIGILLVLILVSQVVLTVVLFRTQKQVRTIFESTVGELTAATETRRILLLPFLKRTPKEQRHVDASPATEQTFEEL